MPKQVSPHALLILPLCTSEVLIHLQRGTNSKAQTFTSLSSTCAVGKTLTVKRDWAVMFNVCKHAFYNMC